MLAIQSWRGFRRRSVFVNARALVGSDTDLRIRCAIAQKSNHTQHTGNYSDKSQKRFHRVKISAFARLLRKFSPATAGRLSGAAREVRVTRWILEEYFSARTQRRGRRRGNRRFA